MEYKILKLEVRDNIGLIQISRPEALNALNIRFFTEMDSMLKELRNNSSVKGVILTGEGKAFVAGADISEMVNMDKAEAVGFSKAGQKVFRSIELFAKPVIAAVNGFALGGGCELAMACDIRIAGVKAKFGQPEVNLGLIPGFAGTQRLPRQIGLGNALHLLMTADMIGAEEAFRVGLVQMVVEQEEILNTAFDMMKKILKKGPEAVQLLKSVVRRGIETDIDAGSEIEAEEFGKLFGNEGTEGMKAFLEKRDPKWEEK
ncbi:MAG: enoyl-CoA hydratase/isomerase family protein [Candidatus Aminicenantes bacterium]|nr:enoyl-CoA hydratase/isomerase family protein [Candidatus Aminicenantes bacterium]